jgi:hypothetical protein
MRKNFSGSKERGVTVEDLKNTVRRELSIQADQSRSGLQGRDHRSDIAEFYNANCPQFNVAEPQYRIAQIVVTPRGNRRSAIVKMTMRPEARLSAKSKCWWTA